MSNQIKKEKIRKFFYRRKINFMTLLVITLLSIAVTLLCRIMGFIPDRVVILEIVSLLLIILCAVQAYRMRNSFRTMKNFRGKRKKKRRKEQ